MTRIIRTPNKVLGGITAEEKVALDAHAQKWTANALRTDPVDPGRLVPAIKSLYAAAGLKEPRVVIVPSPIVMAFAGGFAAAIWWARKNSAKALSDGLAFAATDAATRAATYAATSAATSAATYAATSAATDAATYAATSAATRAATDAATYAATSAATSAATCAATRAATDAATRAATYDATSAATYAATDDATYAATSAATRAATSAATDAATDAATYAATSAATRAATYDATSAATDAATDAATYAATSAATDAATDAATYAATSAATDDATYAAGQFASLALALSHEFRVDQRFMLRCAQNWYAMYQGGNMWSAWDCYLSAFSDVLGLVLPEHEKFRAWEACSLEGGFRIVHEEFCIVSDRPEFIKMDANNRPHCETGPSHRWRDGWSLYHWHGVSIPGEWVTGRPPTARDALTWPNIEQRRAACEIVGWANILRELDARVIDEDGDPEIGTLVEAHIPNSGPERFLAVRCGTGRQFALPVPREMKTAIQSNAWTYGLSPDEFTPEVRT